LGTVIFGVSFIWLGGVGVFGLLGCFVFVVLPDPMKTRQLGSLFCYFFKMGFFLACFFRIWQSGALLSGFAIV
jgi:hypothetical protein